jgi:hypothetical protein
MFSYGGDKMAISDTIGKIGTEIEGEKKYIFSSVTVAESMQYCNDWFICS